MAVDYRLRKQAFFQNVASFQFTWKQRLDVFKYLHSESVFVFFHFWEIQTPFLCRRTAKRKFYFSPRILSSKRCLSFASTFNTFNPHTCWLREPVPLHLDATSLGCFTSWTVTGDEIVDFQQWVNVVGTGESR